jgi:hypothetical protein
MLPDGPTGLYSSGAEINPAFLVGGGKFPGQTCVDLLISGAVVRTASGPNDRPGGSERLDWHTWDVAEYEGRQAVVRVTDTATGGWGHINFDHLASQLKTGSPTGWCSPMKPFYHELIAGYFPPQLDWYAIGFGRSGCA